MADERHGGLLVEVRDDGVYDCVEDGDGGARVVVGEAFVDLNGIWELVGREEGGVEVGLDYVDVVQY